MFSPRSFRLCRLLALCLALATVLATLAPPLHASPLDRAAVKGPVLGLIEWIQGVLSGLVVGVEVQSDDAKAPTAAFLPESSCNDPDGVPIPCPKIVSPGSPVMESSRDSVSQDRPLMR